MQSIISSLEGQIYSHILENTNIKISFYNVFYSRLVQACCLENKRWSRHLTLSGTLNLTSQDKVCWCTEERLTLWGCYKGCNQALTPGSVNNNFVNCSHYQNSTGDKWKYNLMYIGSQPILTHRLFQYDDISMRQAKIVNQFLKLGYLLRIVSNILIIDFPRQLI